MFHYFHYSNYFVRKTKTISNTGCQFRQLGNIKSSQNANATDRISSFDSKEKEISERKIIMRTDFYTPKHKCKKKNKSQSLFLRLLKQGNVSVKTRIWCLVWQLSQKIDVHIFIKGKYMRGKIGSFKILIGCKQFLSSRNKIMRCYRNQLTLFRYSLATLRPMLNR